MYICEWIASVLSVSRDTGVLVQKAWETFPQTPLHQKQNYLLPSVVWVTAVGAVGILVIAVKKKMAATYKKDGKLVMTLVHRRWFCPLTLCGGGAVPLACCVGVALPLCLLSEVEEVLGVDSCHRSLSLLGACGEPGGQSEGACDQTHGPARGTLPLAGVHVLHTSRCSHRSRMFHRKSLDHMAVRGL